MSRAASLSSASFALESSSLRARTGVRHAFFDRTTAEQTAEQTCEPTCDWHAMAREHLRIARSLNVKQVHSAHAVIVRQTRDISEIARTMPEADALVTNLPDLLLCVYTADCAPVLLYDEDAGVCAALHAGWRGALKGIVQETVRSMRTLGADEKRTLAVTGPTISQASYPIGDDFLQPFLRQDEDNRRFFTRLSDQWHFDLPAYVRNLLTACGIENIQDLERDTFSDRSFFSHRRALREGEQEQGRNLSCIAVLS